ncbi:MAG: glycosyltransferase [Clostridiales bacterium]|nr:glycosyltransferase [Clostridiales bacterium]
MPKISIIVPVYKVEEYLPRCVKSLTNQTLQNIEIILVDDGSPDNCPKLCDKYAEEDSRIHVIHKKNGGVSAARNDGLTAASGEWIFFCDSDDWLELNACEILVREGERTNADAVMADINRIKDGKQDCVKFFDHEFVSADRNVIDSIIKAILYPSYCSMPYKNPATGFYGGPWNKAVRRKMLLNKNIKFDTELLGVCDDMLYSSYVLACAKKIAYISKPVYNYIMVSSSITQTYKKNMLDVNCRIFNAFERFLRENNKTKDFSKAYAGFVIRRFEESLRFYFFSEKNEAGLKDRLDELKNTIQSEPYFSAGKTAEINMLQSHHKKAVVLLKHLSVFGLYALYKYKHIKLKINNLKRK